jgi:hypothetical protein
VKPIAFVSLLTASLLSGCVASPPPSPRADIVGAGPVIAFTVGSRTWNVPIPASIRRVPPDDSVQLIDYRNDRGMDYLLLAVEGTSGARNPAGHYCGGGDETTLLWVRFRDGKAMATKQRLIRSCARNIETFRQGWFGQEYRADLFELKDGRTYRSQIRYDLLHLDDGIQNSTWLEE